MSLGLSQLAELYQSGVRITEIMERCNRSARWIYSRLEEVGIEPNRAHPAIHHWDVLDDPLTPVIRDLRRAGMPIADIAAKLDKDRAFVQRRLLGSQGSGFIRNRGNESGIKAERLTDDEKKQILQLVIVEGKTYRETSRVTGRSIGAIRDLAIAARRNIDKTPVNVSWPKKTTNARRALRGRRYDDIENAIPTDPVRAKINARRFQEMCA